MENIKHTIKKIAIIIILIALVIFIGNVVVLANQILILTNVYFVYAFYLLILILLFVFIIIPIRRIMKMPELSKLSIKETDNDGNEIEISADKVYAIGIVLIKNYPSFSLKKNNDDIDAYNKAKSAYEREFNEFKTNVHKYNVSLRDEQIKNVEAEIQKRMNAIDTKIKKYGKRVFILTAVSQNSKFDTLAVWILNIRMIKDIIESSGFRPSYYQLFQIYWRVIITGAFAYATSEVSDMVDETILSEISTEVGIKYGSELFGQIVKIFTKSIADGAVNGLLTLRLGYVTKKYLECGFDKFKTGDRIEIYKSSFKEAWKCKNVIFKPKNKLAS